jgi:predicted acylesterase/phospholipase RssA
MRAARHGPPRRALALAGGGVVGGLYEVGALMALDALFAEFTTCDFDLYVGTSAGAFVASLLANRVSPERLRDALESDLRTLPRLTGSQFLSLPWRSYARTVPRLAAALPRVGRDLWLHWREALVLETVASLLRHLPVGLFSLRGVESYVRHTLTRGGRTNDFRRLRGRLLVPATVLDSGEIHVFGAAPLEATPISAAVAASAAVPLLFEPVAIDGVDYVDASITKTAHAGLAVRAGAKLVVIVNPVRPLVLDKGGHGRIRGGGPLAIAGQALRIALQRRLHEGLRRHAFEHPDTDIVLLEPYERDLQLFDYPLMTYSLRHEVVRRGYRTTVKTLLADFDRFAAVFARHGIPTVPRAEIERRAHRWSRATRDLASGREPDPSVERSGKPADVVPRPAQPARQA